MYREAEEPEPDREGPAIAELEGRVRRARMAMILGTFVVLLPTCWVGFVVARDIQWALAGFAYVWLTAFLGCGIPVIIAFRLLNAVVPSMISRLVRRWIPEIAARHEIMPENLAEYTSHLR